MDFTEIPRDADEELTEELKRKPGCLLRAVRWGLGVTLALIAVGGLAPTLLSGDRGRAWALKKINASIAPAELSVEQWSLGWFRAPLLENVRYSAPPRGLDVRADQVVFDRGLLRMLPVGTLGLGNVTVKNPVIHVTLEPFPAHGDVRPPGKVEGERPREPRGFFLPVADVSGGVLLEDGRLTVSREGGQAFYAEQLNAEVALPSLRKPVDVKLQAQAGGGEVTLGGRLASPRGGNELGIRNQKLGIEGGGETLTLKLSRVGLAAFSPLMPQGARFDSGEADGEMTLSMPGGGQFRLGGGMKASGVSVANEGGAPSPPTDLALLADVVCEKGVVDIARFELTSPWMKANAKGALQFGGGVTGTLNATAESDLPALVRDFGPVLGFSPEFEMRNGRALMALSVNAGGGGVGIEAALVTQELQMRFAGDPLVLKPEPSFMLKAVVPHGGILEIGEMKFLAPFADISASGSLDSGHAKGFLNLTTFSRDFRRVFRSLPPMVGELTLDAATQAASAGRIANVTLTAKDLAAEFRSGARMIVPQGTLKAAGIIPAESKTFSEIQNATFDLTVEGGSASGTCERFARDSNRVPSNAVEDPLASSADKNVRTPFVRGFSMKSEFELGSLRRLVGAFMPEGIRNATAGWDGQVVLNATAESANGTTKALVNAAGINLTGRDGTNTVMKISDVRLSGSVAQERVGGDIQADTEIVGSAAWFRDGRAVFAEKDARLKTDLLIAPGLECVQAKSFNFKSDLLSAQGTFDATDLKSSCMVVAQGKLAVDCESVTRLLDAQGLDEWTLTGRAERNFKFRGPAGGGINTLFAEGEGDAAVFVGSLKGMGLDAGASDVSAKLSGGLMKVSYTPPLNGGKLKCVPEVKLEHGTLTCTLPPKTRLLENVRVSQGMMDALLVNVFPVFRGSIAQDGSATLDVAAFRHVYGITPDKGLAADATLQLKNPSLALGPTMQDLLALLKIKTYSWKTGQLTVRTVIKDGRIHIAPVTVEIEKQPMTLSGWVAFNHTINYQIEIPLTERLIGRDAARALSEKSVKLPVTGTVTAPKIDSRALSKALANVVTETIQEEIIDRANDFLDRLKKELQR